MLKCFQLASKLRVNLYKTNIGRICLDEVNLQRLSIALNCTTMLIPFKYLWLWVGGNPKKVTLWHLQWIRLGRNCQNGKGKLILYREGMYD